jgi:hypothetical protein
VPEEHAAVLLTEKWQETMWQTEQYMAYLSLYPDLPDKY